MKKAITVIFCFAFLFACANSKEPKLKDEKATKAEPQTVVDYYLILPGEALFPPASQMNYVARYTYLTSKAADENEDKTFTIDTTNGYFLYQGSQDMLMTTWTLAIFKKSDGSRILGISARYEGGDAESCDLRFYRYDGGKWLNITEQTIPKLSFDQFYNTPVQIPPEIDELLVNASLLMELPQYGTTATLKITGYYRDFDTGLTPEQTTVYTNLYFGRDFDAVQMKWNAVKGVFEYSEHKMPKAKTEVISD